MQSVRSTNGKRCFCLVQCSSCRLQQGIREPESLPVLEMAISCRLGEAIRFVKRFLSQLRGSDCEICS